MTDQTTCQQCSRWKGKEHSDGRRICLVYMTYEWRYNSCKHWLEDNAQKLAFDRAFGRKP